MKLSFRKTSTNSATNPNRATNGKFVTPKGTYSSAGKIVTGNTGLGSKKLPWRRMAPVIAVVSLVGGYLVWQSYATTLPTNNYSSPPLAYTYANYPADATQSPTKYIKTAAGDATNVKTLLTTSAAVGYAEYNENSSKLAWYEGVSNGTQTILKIKRNDGLLLRTTNGDAAFKQYTISGQIDGKLVWSADGTKLFFPLTNTTTNQRTLNYIDPLSGNVTLFANISRVYDSRLNVDSPYDVLGDGRTIIYKAARYSGNIYQGSDFVSLTQGQTSPTVIYSNAGDCNLFGRRPGTQTEFGFECWVDNSNKFYRKTPTGTPQLIYTTPASKWENGAKNTYAGSAVWAPGGNKLALNVTYESVVDTTTCKYSQWALIYSINTDGTGFKVLTEKNPLKQYTECGGYGGGDPSADLLVWNSKATSIAFISGSHIKILDMSATPYKIYQIPALPTNSTVDLSW